MLFCSVAIVVRIYLKGFLFNHHRAISLFSYYVLILEIPLKLIFYWFSNKEQRKLKPLFRLKSPLKQNPNGYINT